MKINKIVVVTKAPGQPAKIEMIQDDLESMQKIVGGFIQIVPWKGFDLYCHEEGKINQLPPNLYHTLPGDVVVGTVFVSKADENGDPVSLTPEETTLIIKELN